MPSSNSWIAVVALTVSLGNLEGCGAPTPRRYPRQQVGGNSLDADLVSGAGGMTAQPVPPTGVGGGGTGGSSGGSGGSGGTDSRGTGGTSSTGGVLGGDTP